MASMRRRPSQYRGLRWTLFLVGFFAYVLCLTYQRIELKERNGRIAGLERALQGARGDEAILHVAIERECSYAEVRRLAREWGMDVARPDQRVLLAADDDLIDRPTSSPAVAKAGLITLADRFGRIFREGVAQARPARTVEGGDGSQAR